MSNDVLDVLSGAPIEDDNDDTEPVVGGDAHVCAVIGPDGVCGATFDTEQKLKAHKIGKHRDRSGDKKPGPRGGSAPKDKRPSRPKATPTKAAADKAAAPKTDRATVYSAGIAALGLGAYLFVPVVDEFDLNVVTQSAPNLGAAMGEVAEVNATLRTAFDLAFGGGATGGAYVKLFFALTPMVVAILAHHGLLPSSAGARFGEMIGVADPAPRTPTTQDESPAADAPVSAGIPQTADELAAFMEQVPAHVFADLGSKMMGSMAPTVVDVPSTVEQPATWAQREAARDAGGPEQLSPEARRNTPNVP